MNKPVKPKLMIVIHSLKGGGSERVLINLLKGLDRELFSITLVLYERVFDYPLPKEVALRILDIGAGRNIFTLAIGFILKVFSLASLMKKERPDVVFSLLSSTNVTVIAAKLLSRAKCRVIASEHTHPSVNLANEVFGSITGIFLKRFYPRANRIVSVSEGIKQDLVRNFHIRADKIAVIYNPVDIGEIERLSSEAVEHPWFREETPIIVSVGRLTKQKGYPHLINSFSFVRKAFPCRLLIIGEGEDRENLLRMTRERALEGDVEFLGFQKNPFKYMARASLFVLSSLYEGFGNVIVEAMALGLPVISTDCPSGPSEIIEDGKNGLLVPVGDEDALSRAMIEVLTNSALKERLSREAPSRAAFFGIDKIAGDYRSIFLENPSSPL